MEILKSTWAELTHGYSSPEAVRGRSLLMESRAQPAIEDIKRIRQNWLEKFQGDWPDYQDEVRKAIYGYEDEPGERIKGLQEEWQEINHGGQEEVEWTKQAVGLSTALFEKLKRERGNKDFCLRDNQVYYLMLLLLNKGNYLFGKLETQSRGVELPTGEGKTFGMGICAGIMAMRGEDVYVVEPNYISAKDHAGQMGEFIERFSSVQVGVVVDVSEKKGYAREIIVDQKGQIQEGDVRTGGRENYIYLNGELSSAKGSAWREKVLRKKIVYVDPNSLGFDKLEGVLPSLNNRVAIVAEADSVMLDSAFSPWIISEKTTGLPAMDLLSDMCDIEDLVPSEPNMNRTEQRLVTRAILFRLWHAFQTAEDDYFKEGEDFSASKEGVMFEPIAYEKARFLATMAIVGIVKQVNNSSIPDQEVVGLVDNWITNKYQLLEAALRASLGMKEGQEFLRSGK